MEILVLREIATCANQLVPRTEGEITPDFTTEFNATDKTWRVEAFNREPALSFGTWRVNDTTGAVAPLDEVAEDIDTPGFVCLAPLARRARGRTPPLFGTPTPTLVPTATPVPTATTVPTATPPPTAAPPPTTTPGPPLKVEAAEDAATAVWVSVYSCYGHFPLSSSFSATLETPVLWVVEGRSGTTIYGLWSVDAVSGEIEPIDEVARQAKDDCLLAPEVPVSLTPAQASLRAWLAVYECFEPPPKFEFFVGQQLTPQRWVVEGREVQEEEEFDIGPKKPDVLYGLWLVDTDTGQILPWDSLAILTAGRACFKQP